MLTKIELRKQAKAIRNTLNMAEISEKIVNEIQESAFYKASKHVMLFYPLKNEINLKPLFKDDKNFYLPKIIGEDIAVCPYKLGEELTESVFKTKEPVSEPVNPEIIDLIFVPALMVDENFNRLGYGKGFYDKFLTRNSLKAFKIVTIPSQLIIDEIPADDFDAKVDLILHEA